MIAWENIRRDEIVGDKAIFNKEGIKWFPSKNEIREDIYKYILDYKKCIPFISPEKNIIAFGDCFAQHIVKFFIDKGYAINNQNIRLYFYGSQFLNTLSIKEQIEWVMGKINADEINWMRGTKAKSKAVVLSEEERIKIKKDFEKCDVFVFSVGLIEAWINKENQRSLWRKSLKDSDGEFFKVLSFGENKNNIDAIYSYIREINKRCDIIFAVSPIPQNATFSEKSVITSHYLAKSVLSTAIDEILQKYDRDENLHYFPSYELIMSLENPYNDDNRHLTEKSMSIIYGAIEKLYMIK